MEGMMAPSFRLKNQDGAEVALEDFRGKHVLLYFYPKDMTSGCTIEAQSFRDAMAELKDLGVVVLGVSADDEKSHKKFCQKESLNFDLLADTEKVVANAYGVWIEKSMYGRKYMGIERESFLISPEGKIVKHWRKVKPAVHVGEVLDALRAEGKN